MVRRIHIFFLPSSPNLSTFCKNKIFSSNRHRLLLSSQLKLSNSFSNAEFFFLFLSDYFIQTCALLGISFKYFQHKHLLPHWSTPLQVQWIVPFCYIFYLWLIPTTLRELSPLKDIYLSLNNTESQRNRNTYLPTYLPTNLPTYLPIHQPTYLPIYQPTYLPTYKSSQIFSLG